MKTLGIDMGNYAVKTSTKDTFRSVYEEYEYKHEIRNDDVLLYNGKGYVIGKGAFDNTKIKSEKQNTIPLFLNAIYQSIGICREPLRIVVGLPLEHHKNKELIADIKNMYNGLFKFKYKSNNRIIDIEYFIKELYVFPEALGAFYSLNENMMDRDVLLVDIGGGTVNIALFQDGEFDDSITIQEGMNDIYRQIVVKANFTNTGASFGMEDIIKFMKRGKIRWDGNIDNMEYVPSILSKFANNIINEIKGSFPLYKSYDIILSGGGAFLLADYLSKHITFTIMDNNVFSNAIGFYNVGVGAGE